MTPQSPSKPIYGKVVLDSGKVISEGFNIDQVLELSKDMDECEQSLYDMVGDIAVEVFLVRDLALRIIELEKQNAQNIEAKT